VGQSGVGKSSLINRILAGSNLRTGEISSASGEGKHTTVNSSMLILANGAEVIDSPGVRDFAPAIDTSLQAIIGFREISQAGNECRFANCRHQKEPGCNVKALVEQGDISKRRYDSFRRLVVLTEQLAKKRL
jgi:ribosome biogenesis GTPase